MDADPRVKSALPPGTRIWTGLRFATFTITGLYLCLMFSGFVVADARRFYIWVPLTLAGLLMMLFGAGWWGQWWQLVTLAVIPLCLVGFPWFEDKYTEWHINWFDWYRSPLLYIGVACVFSTVGLVVRWFHRRGNLLGDSHKDALPTMPSLATRIAIIILLIVGTLYGSDYLLRSLQGRYEPESIGLRGVKWYAWAPRGFVHEFKYNHTLVRFYHGLLFMDDLFWHQADAAHSGKYPINEVRPEDIWKVYRAWD